MNVERISIRGSVNGRSSFAAHWQTSDDRIDGSFVSIRESLKETSACKQLLKQSNEKNGIQAYVIVLNTDMFVYMLISLKYFLIQGSKVAQNK